MLTQITNYLGISPEGRDFLIANLDPMHDTQLTHLSGWPDVEGAPSVVRCIKQTMTLAKPPSLASGNWDCHVVCWPFLHEHSGAVSNMTENEWSAGSLIGRRFGGVQAWASPAGVGIDLLSTNPLPSFTQVATISLDPVFDKGVGRLVGGGVEVTNTTAELFKQGLCTVYRQPQPKEDISSVLYSGTALLAAQHFQTQNFRRPPFSLETATLYSGTRQWPASDGAYVVYPFIGSTNDPKMPAFKMPLVLPDVASSEPSDPGVSVNAWLRDGEASSSSLIRLRPFKSEPVHMPGIWFTGLSPETTLNVTVNFYYETFPAQDEKELLVLAAPSPRYDPKALELLNFALSTLPVGVPAYMNPGGEWFWEVVETLASFAPAIGAALGGPAGAAIGSGITAGANLLGNYMTSPSPQSAPVRKKMKPLPPIPVQRPIPPPKPPAKKKPLPKAPIRGPRR